MGEREEGFDSQEVGGGKNGITENHSNRVDLGVGPGGSEGQRGRVGWRWVGIPGKTWVSSGTRGDEGRTDTEGSWESCLSVGETDRKPYETPGRRRSTRRSRQVKGGTWEGMGNTKTVTLDEEDRTVWSGAERARYGRRSWWEDGDERQETGRVEVEYLI